jgi:hypothetical protein
MTRQTQFHRKDAKDAKEKQLNKTPDVTRIRAAVIALVVNSENRGCTILLTFLLCVLCVFAVNLG